MAERVTAEDRERFWAEFCAAMPDAGPNLKDLLVAMETTGTIIGLDWGRKNLDRPDRYFKQNAPDGTPDSALRTHRLISFGQQLYDLQDLPGFDDLVQELRTRDLTGASTELQIAHMLTRNGRPVRFVPRRGVKGHDYDQIVSYQDFDIPLEVKTKQDETDYSRATVDDSLYGGAEQVPQSGPSLLVVRIPQAWTTNQTFIGEVDQVTREFFEERPHVNSIIFLWDEIIPLLGDGFEYHCRFRPALNTAPAVPIRHLESLLKAIDIERPPPRRP